MMIGEYLTLTRNPTAHNPSSWLDQPDPTATIPPPLRPSPLSVTNNSKYDAVLTALCRYIQSNEPDGAVTDVDETAIPIDGAYASTDEFRMYEFKVRACTRSKAHDWTECPFAHPGEKARRRDPLRYSYSGTACSDFRKGGCRRADACEFAHGVFECWLHPARYRTQACKDGPNCTRRVCFFAHSPDQLRVGSGQPSPTGPGADPFEDLELVASLRNLQLSKVKSMPARSGWRFGPAGGSGVRPGFYSLPTTPTRPGGGGWFDGCEEEPVMERVESGRELRARMFEKLSKENPLSSLPDPGESGPDVGWVTELVK